MMGLPDSPKSFRIGLVVLIQYRLWQTATQPASQPPSHIAVAITLNALAKASSLKTASRRKLNRCDLSCFYVTVNKTKWRRKTVLCGWVGNRESSVAEFNPCSYCSSSSGGGLQLASSGISCDKLSQVDKMERWTLVVENRVHKGGDFEDNSVMAPCGLRGGKNRPAPFPGRMSY